MFHRVWICTKVGYALVAALALATLGGCASLGRSHQPAEMPAPENERRAMQYFLQAKVYESQRNYLGAIVALRSAADLDPSSPTIFAQLARNYERIPGWRIGPDGMTMVATDGSRLAEFRQSGKGFGDGGTAEVILPPQVCNQLNKLLDGPDELICATLGSSRVLFDLGNTQILSRLIEGPYVDYVQVVPKGNETLLTVDVERLLPAMRRVSILASSYTHQVKMSLSKDNVELTASSQEVGGEAREVLPAIYTADALEVAYNSQFFMDILRRLGSGQAVMELKDSATAAIVRPAQHSEGQELYYLLMPMRPSG